MKNKTAKQILILYRLKLTLVAALYAIALAALIYVMSSFSTLVGIAGIIVLAVSLKAPIGKIREADIESVIFEDLDPEKFDQLLSLGAIKNARSLKVLAAVSLGEYDKALEIIESKSKREHPVETCNDIYRRGYIYFERGEFDKLPALVREYETLKKNNPQFSAILNNFTVFDKFDAFADEDYEYVVEVCDIDLKEINHKSQNHKMTQINVGFYRAVSLYKLGRLDEAKKGFEDIIAFAPKMHKAKLSKEYIKLIDQKN